MSPPPRRSTRTIGRCPDDPHPPIPVRAISRHVTLAAGLELYAYTRDDGATIIEIDTAAAGAVRHNDVGVPRLRVYVNNDIVCDGTSPASASPPRRPVDTEAG